MSGTTDILLLIRGIGKFYDQCMEGVRAKYQMSQMEIKVLNFLHNNPGHDTAAEISELRMLPKGNVSQAVESLIQKGFLMRLPDTKDRRKIHLGFTPQASQLLTEIDLAKNIYQEQLFKEFSLEERIAYDQMNEKILNNVRQGMEMEEKYGQ